MDKPRRKPDAKYRPKAGYGLNRRLFKDTSAMLMHRVEGDEFENVGIHDGYLLIADRAAEPLDGQLVIATVGGRRVVRLFEQKGGRKFLTAGGGDDRPVELRDDEEASVLAVVTHMIPTIDEEQ